MTFRVGLQPCMLLFSHRLKKKVRDYVEKFSFHRIQFLLTKNVFVLFPSPKAEKKVPNDSKQNKCGCVIM